MNEVIDFAWFMDEGNRALNAGNFPEAANAFTLATIHADSGDEVASAYQKAGVCFRLHGEHEKAHIAFETALLYAKDKAMRLRIARDEAAVFMDEGKLLRATELLKASYKGFENEDEAAATLGFLARVEIRRGHRRIALHMLREADSTLKSGANRTYELNNLIWLLKLVGSFARLTLLPRAVRLIKQTGQRRRIVEVALLAVGGEWLHSKAERHARRHR